MEETKAPATAPAVQADSNETAAPAAQASHDGVPAGTPASAGQADAAQTSHQDPVAKNYEELRKQFTKITQEYSKDRKVYGQTARELAELKQAQAKLTELLQQATQKPIDPAQFWQDLQSQGPAALDAYLEAKMQAERDSWSKNHAELVNRNLAQESLLQKMIRRQDAQNYPDFAALEPVMQEIADDPEAPIDWTKPIPEIYDALYKLARDSNSEKAVQQAHTMGRQEAEAALAKEAATAVAGGGKAPGTTVPDMKTMSAAEMRKMFISTNGLADD